MWTRFHDGSWDREWFPLYLEARMTLPLKATVRRVYLCPHTYLDEDGELVRLEAGIFSAISRWLLAGIIAEGHATVGEFTAERIDGLPTL